VATILQCQVTQHRNQIVLPCRPLTRGTCLLRTTNIWAPAFSSHPLQIIIYGPNLISGLQLIVFSCTKFSHHAPSDSFSAAKKKRTRPHDRTHIAYRRGVNAPLFLVHTEREKTRSSSRTDQQPACSSSFLTYGACW